MLPSPPEIADYLDLARSIAQEAAEHALSGFRTGTEIQKKGRIDLVTKYDVECENMIRDRLSRAVPRHRIVGEEKEAVGSGDLVWYVDPIDGTTNFAHGHPFFCTSIGLFYKDVPLVGVIAAPALAVTWWGAKDAGAWRNEERCTVTPTDTLLDALGATGFAYNRWTTTDDNLAEYGAFLKSSQGVRRCGAAALDLACVADGTFDLYWEQGLSPWDVAAGVLLVREAGGRVSDYVGGEVDVRLGQVVATNGPLHDATLRLLGETRAKAGLAARRGSPAEGLNAETTPRQVLRASSSSSVFGQSLPRRRESERSARSLPPVWHVGQ